MSDTSIITDALGRKISFRSPNVLEQTQLLRVIGRANPLDAQNQPYVALVMAASSVVSIDDMPRPKVQRPEDIDVAIAKLGDEGFAAIQVELERRRRDLEDAALAAAEMPVQDLAKNSAATPA